MSIAALAAIFGTSFLVGLTGALSPGPLTTVAVREGMRRGFWAGPLLALGHGVVELALVIGLALGLSQVLDNDTVSATVALAGGTFLLWLGLRVIRTAPAEVVAVGSSRNQEARPVASDTAPVVLAAVGGAKTSIRAAGAVAAMGAAASVTNPFWMVWWATIGAAYIVTALDHGAPGVASFYTGHVITDLGWLSLITFALATGRRVITDRMYHGVLVTCGVLLLGLGAWFVWSGTQFIS